MFFKYHLVISTGHTTAISLLNMFAFYVIYSLSNQRSCFCYTVSIGAIGATSSETLTFRKFRKKKNIFKNI